MDTLIGFRIPGAVVERIDAMAQATGRTRSQIARFFWPRPALTNSLRPGSKASRHNASRRARARGREAHPDPAHPATPAWAYTLPRGERVAPVAMPAYASNPDLRAAALAYAARGLAVFPLVPGAKKPLTEHGHREATTDTAEIERRWQKWPDANVGIACSASGLLVIDVDQHANGADGAATLAALERQHGPLPETWRVLTGGGGLHLYFRFPGDTVGIRVPGTLGPGVDVKYSGYVVVPPSRHPDGGVYQWEIGSAPGDVPLAVVPDWIVTFKPKRTWKGKTTGTTANGAIPSGSRNVSLTRVAGRWRRQGMSADEIFTRLQAENAARCQPPLDADEVQKIAESVARYEPALDESATVAAGTPAPSSAEPVPLATLLDETATLLARYVVFSSPAQCTAAALWVAHAHAIAAADVTGYLAVLSPEKRCGKSRLLELLELLVPAAWLVTRPSEATLFRVLAAEQATLLIDEVDKLFHGKAGDPVADGVCAVLNSGYRRGATVPRCVPPSMRVKRFAVFGAKALGGIGHLPDTVADRSIPIRLQRKKADELVSRWRRRVVVPGAKGLQQRLANWAVSAIPVLGAMETEAPGALHDRAGEIWEPLLSIADLAGGEWPHRARRAALILHEGEPDTESDKVLLLGVFRDLFTTAAKDRIFTADLLRALVEREEGPWGEWWSRDVAAAKPDEAPNGAAGKLAGLLRPFGIVPRTVRDGERKGRGYLLSDCTDAFARYLPSRGPAAETPRQSMSTNDLPVEASQDTSPDVSASNGAKTPAAPGLSRRLDLDLGGRKGSDQETLGVTVAAVWDVLANTPPPIPCPGCQGTVWHRAGDGWTCATCLPPLEPPR